MIMRNINTQESILFVQFLYKMLGIIIKNGIHLTEFNYLSRFNCHTLARSYFLPKFQQLISFFLEIMTVLQVKYNSYVRLYVDKT